MSSTSNIVNADKQYKYYYIYNLKQSLYFIKNGGLIPEDISINPKSKMVYFKFIKNLSADKVFEKWNNS